VRPARAGLCVAVAIVALSACDRAPPPSHADATADAAAIRRVRRSDDTLPASPHAAARDDTRMLPQAFTAGESLASLQARFGAANVRVEDIPGAEGEMVRGVVLFPDDPSRRAYLHFADAENLRGLALVRIVDPASTWTLGDDVHMGTTLAELVARNGAPIELQRFRLGLRRRDRGFHGGKLEPRNGSWPRSSFRLSAAARPEATPGCPWATPRSPATIRSSPTSATSVVVGELTLAYPRQARSDAQSSQR
jgi:hypothetical protein